VSILAFTGCYNKNSTASYTDTKTIDFIVKMGSGEYWNMVKMGAQEAAREFNVNMNFVAPGWEADVEAQEKLVSSAIDRKVDAIVLAASDYKKMSAVVEKASINKIPLIIVDSAVETNKIVGTVSTDNFEAGKLAGEKLAELVGSDSEVAIISFVKDSESAQNREEGVISAISKYPGIDIVAKEYSNSSEELAFLLTKNVIDGNKDLKGIVALNSAASLGAARAVEELGMKDKVKVVAFDSTVLGIQYLEKGVVQATVVQNPFVMGYLALKYASMASRRIDVPRETKIETRVIDKINMYYKENQKFMFQFIK
jgi:ribose transport system substrate-binding protein